MEHKVHLLILLKTNYSRVNTFELKSSKRQINGCMCGPNSCFSLLESRHSQREAKEERRREQLKRKTRTEKEKKKE